MAAAFAKMKPSWNQISLVISKYPVSGCAVPGIKLAIAVHPTPKVCMPGSRVIPMGNVLNSSSFGEKQVFLGLDLQLAHRCSSKELDPI